MLKTFIDYYTKTFVVWVILFGAVSYFAPEPFLALKGGMIWFFGLTMFGIGVALEPTDFKRIAMQPVAVLIGSVAQFTIMPLGAFAVSYLFQLPSELAVGLILTGAAPGAMASNVMSYIAKADTAYSVSLTTVSTLACPILTPTLTYLLAGTQMEVKFIDMMWMIIQTVIIPLLVGFGVRYLFKSTIEKVLYIFPAISSTFIIFIGTIVISSNREYLSQVTLLIFVAVVLLNLYGMAAGYGVGKLFKMERNRKRSLAIEIGMQNAGLGTVLAMQFIGPQAAIPTAVFVFVCIITASIMAEVWHSRDSKSEIITEST